jgi:hypothetical protein
MRYLRVQNHARFPRLFSTHDGGGLLGTYQTACGVTGDHANSASGSHATVPQAPALHPLDTAPPDTGVSACVARITSPVLHTQIERPNAEFACANPSEKSHTRLHTQIGRPNAVFARAKPHSFQTHIGEAPGATYKQASTGAA